VPPENVSALADVPPANVARPEVTAKVSAATPALKVTPEAWELDTVIALVPVVDVSVIAPETVCALVPVKFKVLVLAALQQRLELLP